jgi:glutathione S-transferase
MKLYYAPGTCALASHIVLCELALPHETEQVDIRAKKTKSGGDYAALNPKGYVPLLQLDDGTLLSEGPAILQYLADRKPEAKLAPANGTVERYKLQEWLAYINSEVHKSYSGFFNPAATPEQKEALKPVLARRLGYVEQHLAKHEWLVGNAFSVADAYLYVVLGWSGYVGFDLAPFPKLREFHARVAQRPAVQAAQAAEKG